MRDRTSFWNPFITESTTISAATPSAMPSIDVSEMNEMKWLRRLARVYRSPTRSSYCTRASVPQAVLNSKSDALLPVHSGFFLRRESCSGDTPRLRRDADREGTPQAQAPDRGRSLAARALRSVFAAWLGGRALHPARRRWGSQRAFLD